MITDLEELKSKFKIKSILAKSGINIQHDKISCLWHTDKTASCHIYGEDNTFYCFGCQKRGDVIDVVEKLNNTDFKGAIRLLGGDPDAIAPVNIHWGAPIWSPDADYIDKLLASSIIPTAQTLRWETEWRITLGGKAPADIVRWFDDRMLDISLLHDANLSQLMHVWYSYLKINWPGPNYRAIFPSYYPYDGRMLTTSLRARRTSLNEGIKDIESQNILQTPVPGYVGLAYWAARQMDGLLDGDVWDDCAGLTVILVEGAPDLLAALEIVRYHPDLAYPLLPYDVRSTIVLTTGNLGRANQAYNLNIISKAARVLVCYDDDDAGNNAAIKVARRLYTMRVNVSIMTDIYNGHKDFNDLLKAKKTPAENRRPAGVSRRLVRPGYAHSGGLYAS